MSIRRAEPDDVPRILAMIQALAEYEREPDAVEATEESLRTSLFGDSPQVFAHVAVADDEVVGMAIWFLTFSTWTGTHGIWLEDLFVEPDHRGSGLGRDLLAALARECADQGYRRLEWWVLNWNAPSIAFYESLGATAQEEWTTYRLDGESLSALSSAPHSGS